MKRFSFLLLIACVLAFSAGTASAGKPMTQQGIEQAHHDTDRCQGLNANGLEGGLLAQSGCCSHHSGVCGCSGGRTTCCDGSLSPSCGCNSDDPKDQPAT